MTKFLNISKDETLGGNNASDEVVSAQKAVKAYVDGKIPDTTSSVTSGSTAALTSGGAYTNLVKRKSTSAATGSSTQGVYIDSAGKVQPCTAVTSTYTATGTAPVNGKAVANAIVTKQDNLVSGTNIKTINGTSLLGNGNITIETSSTPNVDGGTISYNSSDALQTIAVKNKRDNSTLPIWQGTYSQWYMGAATTWYYWQTSVSENIVSFSTGFNNGFYSIIYGNGKFFGVSDGNHYNIYTSDDGTNWTQISTSPIAVSSIVYGNGIYVISNGIESFYSTDGINWIQGGNFQTTITIKNAIYAFDKFIILSTSNIIEYSTDGINWTEATSNVTLNFNNIAYGNGKLVGVKYDGTIAYSTDGINWTEQTTSYFCKDIAFGDGKFVAVSHNSNVSIYSTDGINWIESALPYSSKWTAIGFGDEKFVCVSEYSSWSPKGFDLIYSTDGINWIDKGKQNTRLDNIIDVLYGNNKFIIANRSDKNQVYYSIDFLYCYTDTANPTTASTVYSAPDTVSTFTISSVTSGAITLSDNNTYYYNQSGNANTYQSVGEAHPDWLCFINGVGVKIGTTTIATNNSNL